MPVWQEAMSVAEEVFRITEGLPKKEDYGLTSQLRRGALSISANIAEAYGRKHSLDKIKFYYFARASSTETQNHLEYGMRVGYFNREQIEDIDKRLNQIYNDINKIIITLRS